jgi:HAD superfamily hydrolase (TIGR01457 family)
VIADGYDAFLFDLDGVLYRGDEPVDGAPEAMRRLRAAGKRIAFVTNNSSRTPASIAEKLASVGIHAEPQEVATSALATADLLASRGVATAYVVGEEGIRSALHDVGIRVLDAGADGVEVVVVGFDRGATYDTLAHAALLVERGAHLVATNADASYPAPEGALPGAGALLAVVTTTTGAEAEVVGKPHPPLLRAALERAGGGRPLVIGDRLDTDVAGAHAVGWDCVLVLTGITDRAQAERADPRPTYVVENLGGLFGDPPGAQEVGHGGGGGTGG